MEKRRKRRKINSDNSTVPRAGIIESASTSSVCSGQQLGAHFQQNGDDIEPTDTETCSLKLAKKCTLSSTFLPAGSDEVTTTTPSSLHPLKVSPITNSTILKNSSRKTLEHNTEELPSSTEDIPLGLFRDALGDALLCGDLARLGRGFTLAARHGHSLASLIQNQGRINMLEAVLCDQISNLHARAPCAPTAHNGSNDYEPDTITASPPVRDAGLRSFVYHSDAASSDVNLRS
jgi:hypothetical protein